VKNIENNRKKGINIDIMMINKMLKTKIIEIEVLVDPIGQNLGENIHLKAVRLLHS